MSRWVEGRQRGKCGRQEGVRSGPGHKQQYMHSRKTGRQQGDRETTGRQGDKKKAGRHSGKVGRHSRR